MLASDHLRERERERRQHDRAGEGEPERQPERAARRVHARGLARALLRDGRQRVVVELGHQQPEPAAGDQERDRQRPAGVRAWDDREQHGRAQRDEREPGADDGSPGAAHRPFLPASSATPNMLSDSGASDRPACIASYSSTICRKIGSAMIRPPRAICCSHLLVTPRRKYGDSNSPVSSSAGLPSRLRRTEPVDERAEGERAEREQRADRLAALLPHEDAEHDAAHADDGEERADRVDAARARVRHVTDELDARQHDGDDHDLAAGTRRATTGTW